MRQKNSISKESTIKGSYTTMDVARMLNVTRQTAVNFIKEGHFPVYEVKGVYRVKKADFEHWLECGQEE